LIFVAQPPSAVNDNAGETRLTGFYQPQPIKQSQNIHHRGHGVTPSKGGKNLRPEKISKDSSVGPLTARPMMSAKRNRPSHVTRGNIFDDLGFPPHDVVTLKIKAKILDALLDRIHERQYTQAQLAEILADYQLNIGNLIDGEISKMRVEKLLYYANRLNLDVQISLR
jgi:predicted XRE-type DNA-binding protein